MKTLRRTFFLLVIVFAIAMLPAISKAQQVQADKRPEEPHMIEATEQEFLQFWGWVMDHVDADPKYLPPQTAKRLQWAADQLNKKQLSFELATGIIPDQKATFVMIADYVGEKPLIRVNLSILAIWYWESYKSKTPLSHQERNNLAVFYSHEIIHLQHGPLVLTATKTDTPLREFEERRTWAMSVIEDIRPLLEKGEPLREDFVLADKTLRACGDDQDCPAFKKLMEEHALK